MPAFNDLDLKNWKESEIWTDSLWLIPARDKRGKHDGFYHGNFIPQIPRQFILRYTKQNEIVFDPFLGSGTTAYEAEELKRNFIGIDIQPKMVEYVKNKLENSKASADIFDEKSQEGNNFADIIIGDSSNEETFIKVNDIMRSHKRQKIQFAILHPPYWNIIKFSDNKNDLSGASSLDNFLKQFAAIVKNTVNILDINRYIAIVIGDKYSAGEWVPLGFHCMEAAKESGLILKSIIIKNMEGNRAKKNQGGIWRYRALSSDYYIFKHEYILVFKKTK